MTPGTRIGRRRTLSLLAATAGLGLVGPAASGGPPATRWQGSALGARAQLVIHHPDPATGRRLVTLALAEVERLERIFSLHRPDSALVRLNREGRLDAPPLELVTLLERARFWSVWSGGAFDATVQPLWALYRDHFAAPAADPAGPPLQAVRAARDLVDYRGLDIGTRRIAFARPAMAVTLNGIAQGYITDRVADLLRGEGMTRVLVDLGEIQALGQAPGGRPWRIGLAGRDETLQVVDRAVATSAADGTLFEASGRFHHLLDPKSGRPAPGRGTVTVVARRAGDADALSTALSVGEVGRGVARTLPGTIERVLVDGLETRP